VILALPWAGLPCLEALEALIPVLAWVAALGVGAVGVWTAPRTWVAGEVVTAALMNTHVRDNLIDLDSRVDLAQQLVQESITVTASGRLTPAAGSSVLVLDSTGAYTLYGMSVPASAPFAIDIINVSANNLIVAHESGSEATPACRFYNVAGGSVTLSLGEGIRLLYITVAAGSRWVSMIGS
jgi:hypothetical protein